MDMFTFQVFSQSFFHSAEFDKEAVALCKRYNVGGYPMRTWKVCKAFYQEFPRNFAFFKEFHALCKKYYDCSEIFLQRV